MIPAFSPHSRSDLIRLCGTVHRQLSSLVDAAASLQEHLERLEWEYLQLMQKLGLLTSMQARSVTVAPGPKQPRESRRALQEKALQGVDSVKVVSETRGAGILYLNDKEVVRLSPELAALTTVLTNRAGESPDELVPWRTLSEVRSALQALTGKVFSRKAVHQLVHRLRKALTVSKQNRFLVMSDRYSGYRFALRRNKLAVTLPVTGTILPGNSQA